MLHDRLKTQIDKLLNAENSQRDILLELLRINQQFKVAFVKYFLNDFLPDNEYAQLEIDGEIIRNKGKDRYDLFFKHNGKDFFVVEVKSVTNNSSLDEASHTRFQRYLEYCNNNKIKIGLLVNNPDRIITTTYQEYTNTYTKVMRWLTVNELFQKYFTAPNTLSEDNAYWSTKLLTIIKENTKYMSEGFNLSEINALNIRNNIENKIIFLLSKALLDREGITNYYPKLFNSFNEFHETNSNFQDRHERLGLALTKKNDDRNKLALFFGIQFSKNHDCPLLLSFIESDKDVSKELKNIIRTNANEIGCDEKIGYKIFSNDSRWQIVQRNEVITEFSIGGEKKKFIDLPMEQQVEYLRAWYDETRDIFIKILERSGINIK